MKRCVGRRFCLSIDAKPPVPARHRVTELEEISEELQQLVLDREGQVQSLEEEVATRDERLEDMEQQLQSALFRESKLKRNLAYASQDRYNENEDYQYPEAESPQSERSSNASLEDNYSSDYYADRADSPYDTEDGDSARSASDCEWNRDRDRVTSYAHYDQDFPKVTSKSDDEAVQFILSHDAVGKTNTTAPQKSQVQLPESTAPSVVKISPATAQKNILNPTVVPNQPSEVPTKTTLPELSVPCKVRKESILQSETVLAEFTLHQNIVRKQEKEIERLRASLAALPEIHNLLVKLSTTSRDTAQRDIHTAPLQRSILELTAEKNELKHTCDKLNAQVSSLNAELQQLRSERRREFSIAENSNAHCDPNSLSPSGVQDHIADNDFRSLRAQLADTQAKLSTLSKQHQLVCDELKQSSSDVSDLKAQLLSKNSEIIQLKAALESREPAYAQHTKKLQEASENFAFLKKLYEEEKHLWETQREEIRTVITLSENANLKAIQKPLVTLISSTSKWFLEHENLCVMLKNSENNFKEITQVLTTHVDQLNLVTKTLQSRESELTEKTQQIAKLTQTVQDIQSSYLQCEKELTLKRTAEVQKNTRLAIQQEKDKTALQEMGEMREQLLEQQQQIRSLQQELETKNRICSQSTKEAQLLQSSVAQLTGQLRKQLNQLVSADAEVTPQPQPNKQNQTNIKQPTPSAPPNTTTTTNNTTSRHNRTPQQHQHNRITTATPQNQQHTPRDTYTPKFF
ncbi:hypothetical protein Pelo_10815 [Pelomyxa schiedti]|nr:hypothetical protein Pelo_10815 [Pelomyxa schiedti]